MTNVCPNCGSKNIREQKTGDPTYYTDGGHLAVAICEDCGEPLHAGEVD